MAFKIEVELAGFGAGWADISADVLQDPPIHCEYGITGSGPMDRVADTGTLTFALKNNAGNSGGLLGYYSLEHANKRSGWDLGIRVRFSYTIGATTYYKFIGRLSEVAPAAGRFQRLAVICTALDWMDEAARYRLATLAMQSNKRADELIALVAAAVPVQPVSSSYDTGTETYVLSLDETVEALTELQKIAMSELGLIYLKGDTTGGGKLRLESRLARLSAGAAAATLTDSELQGLEVLYDREQVINKVFAKTHPRTEDAAATSVLFDLQGTPLVTAGSTIRLTGDYTDPNQRAIKVTGRNMVAPVATTHYLMNAASDGSGANLTANFTVTAAYTGSAVFYDITNNGAVDGYITFLQAVGRGVYDFEPVEAQAFDSASITAYGEHDVQIDMPYQSDANIGEAVAGFVRSHYADPPGASATSVSFQATPATSSLKTHAYAREPGDRITVTETATGLDHTYFINSVTLDLYPADVVQVSWGLYRGEERGYWNLEVPGYSELGLTTRLAPL